MRPFTRKKNKNISTVGQFNESDFYSNNGFMTSIWGPSMWFVLHMISFNYPCNPRAIQKRQYMTFFNSLKHILPCGKCRTNLTANLECTKYGPHVFQNRETLSRWVYKLHCCVNDMLHKKTTYSYEDTRTRFENFRARCRESDVSNKTMKIIEDGCTDPVNGLKSKCLLVIKPLEDCLSSETLNIDERCLCKRPGG